jgi:hypothetical protein
MVAIRPEASRVTLVAIPPSTADVSEPDALRTTLASVGFSTFRRRAVPTSPAVKKEASGLGGPCGPAAPVAPVLPVGPAGPAGPPETISGSNPTTWKKSDNRLSNQRSVKVPMPKAASSAATSSGMT